MKVYRLLPVASLALFAGCSGDSVANLVTPDPHAAVRWVNAVPDTMDLDYRIVDVVTNANEASVKYRGNSGAYRAIPPGSHRIRVFPASTTAACNAPDVVSQILLDTTFTFQTNHYYTVVHAGYMKAGATPQQHLIITDDAFPAAAAGSFSLRVMNAFGSSVDAFTPAGTATGAAVSGSPAFANVAFGATTDYKSIAVASAPPTASTYRVAATAAGTTTPIISDGLLPIGAAAFAGSSSVPPLDPIGGSQQSGSVMTTILTPASVAYTLTSSGSDPKCAAAGTTTVVKSSAASSVTIVDKNPNDKILGQ